MLDFSSVFEFSRQYCVPICAVLIPVNLLMTIGIMVLVACQLFSQKLRFLASLESLFALLIIFHVSTWLMVGVIQLTTFILLGLSFTCLVVTWSVVLFSAQFRQFMTYAETGFLKVIKGV